MCTTTGCQIAPVYYILHRGAKYLLVLSKAHAVYHSSSAQNFERTPTFIENILAPELLQMEFLNFELFHQQ
jgi:hypothetical protein